MFSTKLHLKTGYNKLRRSWGSEGVGMGCICTIYINKWLAIIRKHKNSNSTT